MLPIADDKKIVSLGEGFTDLVPLKIDKKQVLVKMDHQMPTGSFKDRGASVLMSKIKELGVSEVVEDSSGNAGCAIAAYSQKAKIGCKILVPEKTPEQKLRKIRNFGVNLTVIPGDREDCARAAMEMAEKIFYASHVWNPFFISGTRTFGYEVSEQLGWQVPDAVVLPCGNGTLLLGAYLGFKDLVWSKVINQIPRIIGVQAANCSPLAAAFSGREVQLGRKETVARGIAIARPPRAQEIIQSVKATKGLFITVSEPEIEDALKLSEDLGYHIEPTAAATIAGLRRYLHQASTDELIVSVFSGQNV